MAICLDHQSVYLRGETKGFSLPLQIGAGLLLLCALTLKVWVKLESVELGYQLAREREIAVQLDMERRELELQRSVLLRPDALSHNAKVRLGLLPVEPNKLVRLEY